MGVELHAEPGTNILDVTVTGKLEREDYKNFIPEVERAITERGKLRMLCTLKDFHGWTAGALWEDIKFDVRHFADFERVAFIGDRKWEQGMAAFCKPFTSAAIRYFDVSEAGKAREWVHEAAAQPTGK
jgi:hypothetical protein